MKAMEGRVKSTQKTLTEKKKVFTAAKKTVTVLEAELADLQLEVSQAVRAVEDKKTLLITLRGNVEAATAQVRSIDLICS